MADININVENITSFDILKRKLAVIFRAFISRFVSSEERIDAIESDGWVVNSRIEDSAIEYTKINGYEEGSNSNGRYTKFPDGTLICYHNQNSVFRSSSELGHTWTFPFGFLSPPIVNATMGDLSSSSTFTTRLGVTRAVVTSSTEAAIRQHRINGQANFSPGDTAEMNLMAIGRWK